MDRHSIALLELLQSKANVTANELAIALGVSEKTIRSRLNALNHTINSHGATIRSKSGKGYNLVITSKQQFHAFLSANHQDYIPTSSSDRIIYIMYLLLTSDDYLKLDDIAEQLYFSRNTVSNDLKEVEKVIHTYDLTIERRPNHGMKLNGNEFSKRLCLAYCYTHEPYSSQLTRSDLSHRVSTIVRNVFAMHQTNISETSFLHLIVHLVVAIERIRQGHGLSDDQQQFHDLDQELSNYIQSIAYEVCEKISEQVGIHYDAMERLSTAIHLTGKISSDSQSAYGQTMVISSTIDALVLKMINFIYETYHLDFRRNLELRMSLNQHMVPMDIRMRFNIPLKNPLLQQIQTNYAYAYEIAVSTCSILMHHYGKTIPNDEIGYIAILIALAMEKREREPRRYNIVVVCVSGRGTSQLFMYRYKQAFGQYIDHIYESTVYEIESFDFKGHNIDLVFTTIPLPMNLPVPVFEVSPILSSQEIDNYQKLLATGNIDFIHRYFYPDLFIPSLSVDTKEEALTLLSEFVARRRIVPNDFYNQIIKRELWGQTDFGNLVAIPHAASIFADEAFVAVVILEHPIWWGHHDVQIIFLISLSKSNTDNEDFYAMITNFISDIHYAKSLIDHPEYDHLLDLLAKAYRQ